MLSGIHFKEKVQSVPEGKFIRIRRKDEDENVLWELLTNLNIRTLDPIDILALKEKGVLAVLDTGDTNHSDFVFSKGILFTSEGEPVYNLAEQYLSKESLVSFIKDLPLGSAFNLHYQDKSIVVNKFIPLLKKLNIFFHYDDYNEPTDKTVIHCRLFSTNYFSSEGIRLNQRDHVIELVLHDTAKHFSIR